MDWPNPQDYNEAVQNPAVCFADAELRNAQIELSPIGLPKPSTGAFASVYKLNGIGKSWAVRCFHNEVPDHKLRYEKILATLKALKPSWAPPMEYIAQGIKVQGQWLPVIKMDWLNGIPLDRFLAKHGENSDRVKKIAERLRTIVDEMRAAGIAHGDLQHGNILIQDDNVMLIDFDGMYVPDLQGMKSAELGHPNYQHPYRSREHFGSYIDNFSAWLIEISLMSLAADPELLVWGQDRECLLFCSADLLNPYESRLFSQLREHSIDEIRQSAQTLIQLLRAPVEFVPSLDASQEDLLNLPELDPGEQMRLIEEIQNTDVVRFAEKPAVLSALSSLSIKKRGAKDKFSSLWKQASSAGEAMLTTVLSQMMTAADLATKADECFAASSYKEALDFYIKALDAVASNNQKPAVKGAVKMPKAIEEEQLFENRLNIRAGHCCLLNNNPAASVIYFKTVLQRKIVSAHDKLNCFSGLMAAYCQLGRSADAQALLEDKQLLQDLSYGLLNNAQGPLRSVPGLGMALKFLAEHFQKFHQYGNAASIYEAARAIGASQSVSGATVDGDADILLKLGHCYLLGKRPDLAIRSFKQIVRLQDDGLEGDAGEPPALPATGSEELHDRALIGMAVAFKMMNSSQDVVKALRTSKPERIYNGMKKELDGPLAELDEFAQVACAFVGELGEADLMGGVRLATRLAADSFRRADDKKRSDQIISLLEEGKFKEANELADEELIVEYKLQKKFSTAALAQARDLTARGDYKEAFELVKKYKLPDQTLVSTMEGQVIDYMRSAARQEWHEESFLKGFLVCVELCIHSSLSNDIREFLVKTMCNCQDRSEQFATNVRMIADLIESHNPEGSSHPQVLRLRGFVLNIESPPPEPPPEKEKKQTQTDSELLKKFHKSTEAAKVPANARQMEIETLDALSKAAQARWTPESMEHLLNMVRSMKVGKSLTKEFCEKLAGALLNHFNETSGINRWNKEAKDEISKNRKTEIRKVLNEIMDLFSQVPRIESGTLRKLNKCIEKV